MIMTELTVNTLTSFFRTWLMKLESLDYIRVLKVSDLQVIVFHGLILTNPIFLSVERNSNQRRNFSVGELLIQLAELDRR